MTKVHRIAGEDAMDELVAAIGRDAAFTLARRFGGTGLYVPRAIGEHHPICVAIGRAAADHLATWGGGSTISIPKQIERRARVLALHRTRSLTTAQIAAETGYSQRHVFRLLRDHADQTQPGLFD